MRELKFRVWNGQQMEYDVTVGKFGVFYVNPMNGDGLDPNDYASLTSCNTKYPENIPVMQFTGMKDQDGSEIYEGDILTSEGYPYQDEGKRNYDLHVEFIHGCWQGVMNLVNPEKRGISDGINNVLNEDGEETIPFKKIGNIYQGVSLNL